MKDIPLFTAGSGIATLLLREIPTRGEAYVLVRTLFGPAQELLQECAKFCREAGASSVYFGGNADFSGWSVHARLLERSVSREKLGDTAVRAVPTADPAWAALYRERFSAVPAARSYGATPAEGAYFLLDGACRVGLGLLRGGELSAVASLARGRGADCVRALAKALDEPVIRLVCAEENLAAMRLYDRLGFSVGPVREVWYRGNF